MATLRFPIAATRRVADHSIQAQAQMRQLVGFSQDGDEPVPQYRAPTEPCVQLVHDDGIYLMRNGLPLDLLDGTIEQGRRFVAYAEGCDPQHDPDGLTPLASSLAAMTSARHSRGRRRSDNWPSTGPPISCCR
jgi:DUF3085 family protein